MRSDAVLRIGELSRRSGVSPELLRAWERRYGVLRPLRSSGGLRLYSLDDLERVRRMREHLERGLAAAEAAALVTRADSGSTGLAGGGPATARAELAATLEAFDEPGAQAVLDARLAAATLDTVLAEVVLPVLHELGERWQRGEVSVAQEHFASSVVRGRLLGLARGWGRGLGPLALLACLPGEEHELGLMAFGLALRARGWRITYLGADVPVETVDHTAHALEPELVVLSSVAEERVLAVEPELRRFTGRHRLSLGGRGASGEAAAALDVLALPGDVVAEAGRVTTLVRNGRS